jgi:hypothetical protein
MKETGLKEGEETQKPLSNIKTYSVEEIMAAGGTTAFANKLGKNYENIISRLKELPKDAFLTDEEYNAALAILKNSK